MRQEQNQRRYCIKKEPLHNSGFSIEENARPETGNDANKGDGRMTFGLQAELAEKQSMSADNEAVKRHFCEKIHRHMQLDKQIIKLDFTEYSFYPPYT